MTGFAEIWIIFPLASPLIHAVAQSDLHMVQYLIDKYADIESKSGNVDLWDHSEMLIQEVCGATPLICATNGTTPGLELNELKIVQYLAGEHGANVEARANNGYTALMTAVSSGSCFGIIRYLVAECGANIDSTSADGSTALICAASAGRLEVVQYLASDRGADIQTRLANGRSARMVAAQSGHRDVVAFLTDLAIVKATAKQAEVIATEREADAKATAAANELLALEESGTPELQARMKKRNKKLRNNKPDPIIEGLRASLNIFSTDAAERADNLPTDLPESEANKFNITDLETGASACVPKEVSQLEQIIKDQAAELDRREQCIKDLNYLLDSKDSECIGLIKQNQDLFADVSELKHNYEMVSELYDEAFQQRGRAEKCLAAEGASETRSFSHWLPKTPRTSP